MTKSWYHAWFLIPLSWLMISELNRIIKSKQAHLFARRGHATTDPSALWESREAALTSPPSVCLLHKKILKIHNNPADIWHNAKWSNKHWYNEENNGKVYKQIFELLQHIHKTGNWLTVLTRRCGESPNDIKRRLIFSVFAWQQCLGWLLCVNPHNGTSCICVCFSAWLITQ